MFVLSERYCNQQNEDDLAAQLVGFLGQFLEVFSELKGKKLYLSGESVRFPFCYHICRLTERPYQVCRNVCTLYVIRGTHWLRALLVTHIPLQTSRTTFTSTQRR